MLERGGEERGQVFSEYRVRPPSRLWQEVFCFQRSSFASRQEMSAKIGFWWEGREEVVNELINK